MPREELIQVLNYDKKNAAQAKLPKRDGLAQEVLRWDPKANSKKLKSMRRDDLISALYQALGAKPRRRVSAKRYHRFGLSFDYKGDFPALVYREGMDIKELKAMFELYPNPKISVAQLKAILKEYRGAKLTGGKNDLMNRVRDCLDCRDIHNKSWYTYTAVSCWEDELPTLQAKFDDERKQWQAEINQNKENSAHLKKAQAEKKAQQEKADSIKKKRELEASSRPWIAKPYDPKSKTRAEFEAEWKARNPKLSFPYSGARLPNPEDFHDVVTDYFTDQRRYAHHLLAYLEQGFGGFDSFTMGQPNHRWMTKEQLKRIHGRQCTHLGTSLAYACETLKREVAQCAGFRFQNGL